MARAEALNQKQDIQREEALLKAKKERFKSQTVIAAPDAKLQVLNVHESARHTPAGPRDGMNAYLDDAIHAEDEKGTRCSVLHSPERVVRSWQHNPAGYGQNPASQTGLNDFGNMLIHHQNEITKLLVKQQKVSTLPPLNIAVFSGDPFEFGFFLKHFNIGLMIRLKQQGQALFP